MSAKIIKAEEAVARQLKTVAPILSSYFTEEMVVQMLQEGEKLAKTIKKKEDEMMVKAKEHVEQKKVQLEQEIEQLKNNAYQEGLEAGKQEFIGNLQSFVDELEIIKLKAGLAMEVFLDGVEGQIVKFSISLAEKVTRITFEKQEDVFIDFVKKLFDQISIKESIVIKVNPRQFAILNKHKEEFSEYLGISNLGIQKDSSIDEYGIGIALDTGFMDAGIASQFSQIEKNLLNG